MVNSFREVFLALTSDYLMLTMLFNAVAAFLIAAFLFLDPVQCSMHNKHFHRLLGAAFAVTAFTRLDRIWNRGLWFFNGNAPSEQVFIDGEIAVAIVLTAILFMVAYDSAKNNTAISLRTKRRMEEFHSPCDGCIYRPHVP